MTTLELAQALLEDIKTSDEVFDGFDTAYPACIALKIKGHDK